MRQKFRSFTEDPEWIDLNTERLLGFEILRNICRGRSQEVAPGLIADKLGLDKGIVHETTRRIRKRLTA